MDTLFVRDTVWILDTATSSHLSQSIDGLTLLVIGCIFVASSFALVLGVQAGSRR